MSMWDWEISQIQIKHRLFFIRLSFYRIQYIYQSMFVVASYDEVVEAKSCCGTFNTSRWIATAKFDLMACSLSHHIPLTDGRREDMVDDL